MTSLKKDGEGRAGSEVVQQLEVEQLRRQLHQLQADTEVGTGAVCVGGEYQCMYMYVQVQCVCGGGDISGGTYRCSVCVGEYQWRYMQV